MLLEFFEMVLNHVGKTAVYSVFEVENYLRSDYLLVFAFGFLELSQLLMQLLIHCNLEALNIIVQQLFHSF